MKSIQILLLLLHFYSNFVEANEDFKFIEEQFKNCKNLENERRNFEAMKNNAEYGWDKIEPKNELKKCILDFDIKLYFNQFEKKFKRFGNLLNTQGDILSESRQLRIFSAELEKMHLNKELMEILRAKIGDGIQDKGIIQSTDSEDEDSMQQVKGKRAQDPGDEEITQISDSEDKYSSHGKGKQQPDNLFSDPFLAEFNRLIDEMINKNNVEGSSSSCGRIGTSGENIQGEGEHNQQQQIQAETNILHVQILKSIYDFRKELNTEIKWLNMMLWLKKSKAYMEKIGHRLGNEKQTIGLFDNFFKRQFAAPQHWEGSNSNRLKLKSEKKPKNFSYYYGKIENNWIKERNSLQQKLEEIKKKSEKHNKDKLQLAGNTGMRSDRRSAWPHYDELLAKINFMKKLDLEKDSEHEQTIKIMDSKELEQINKLQTFILTWNNAVDESRSKINRLIDEYRKINEEYEKIFYCVALHRVTSMAFQLLMGIFEWENVEWKMAAIGHLVDDFMKFYILNLVVSKKEGQMNQLQLTLKNIFDPQEWQNPLNLIGNPKLMDDDQMLIESRDIQIQVVIDALRVLTFYEKLNGIILETNGLLKENDVNKIEKIQEEFKKEINEFIKMKLPDHYQQLKREYWKLYEENVNNSLKKTNKNHLRV